MKKLLTLIALLFAASASQAQSINDSLLLYLPFNGNANDASGNGNNGTVYNATLTTDRTGTANAAYDFNGTDSYIEIPASSSLSKIYTSNEVTIAAWINIRNWYNNWNVFAVFEQYDPNTDWGSVLLEANWSSGGILFESGYNTNYIGCDYTWNFNEWHHLAVTYSKVTDTAKFYVDGNLLCSKEYLEAFTPDLVNTYVIGRSLSGPDEYSDGIIDEVRVYNRALHENELLNLPTNTTNVKEQRLQSISIYPNPASDRLVCKNENQLQQATVSVKNLLGKEVIRMENVSGNELNIDIHTLPAGAYFIHIRDGGKQLFGKFLKQ